MILISQVESNHWIHGRSLKERRCAYAHRGLDHPHLANVSASTQPQCAPPFLALVHKLPMVLRIID
jgi:hypothetical protein